MSLTRRNITACILILVSSAAWIYGYAEIRNSTNNIVVLTTVASTKPPFETTTQIKPNVSNVYANSEINSIMPSTQKYGSKTENDMFVIADTTNHDEQMSAVTQRKYFGIFLCATSLISAAAAVFILWQKNAFQGPDIALGILSVYSWVYHTYINGYGAALPLFQNKYIQILLLFFLLISLRELFGWIFSKFSIDWSLSYRLAKRIPMPQIAMTVFLAQAALSITGIALIIQGKALIAIALLTAFGLFGFSGLWKYGSDIGHFEKQLANFRSGKEITVKDGSLSKTEIQLKEVQKQHEEAVKAAVIGERFKVELIANVSHDLRTPLTSILGYSELLQNEELSEKGKEQLTILHRKAGYMNDLVEALFELTKVSSGVIECKKQEIDLIKLLEQTVGLFDDRLTACGLTVRRSYASDSVQLFTDGARMHQVFANLLENAIKYALSGTRIHLNVTQNDSFWTIRLVNTASYEMNFDEAEIMQRFARGDKARSASGSGLGLAIAQTYTESVGGSFRIHVDGDQFNAIVELPKM